MSGSDENQPIAKPNFPPLSASPSSTPASAINGGREVSNKILYVGNLHGSISEDQLYELFNIENNLKTIKVLHDKNKPGFNYAFVEFKVPESASKAIQELSGKSVNNFEIRINWAYHSSNANTVQSLEPVFNIFVGDLAADIDDERLTQIFSAFSSLKEAHVMWDMQTSRSRGYGFVTFFNQNDATMALKSMNGEVFNGRAIRCNWASHKQANQKPAKKNFRAPAFPRAQFRPYGQSPDNEQLQHGQQDVFSNGDSFSHFIKQPNQIPISNGQMMPPSNNQPQAIQFGSTSVPAQGYNMAPQQAPQPQPLPNNNIPQAMSNTSSLAESNNMPLTAQTYDIVLRQTPNWQTTVYLGNIAHFSQESDIIPLLQNFGYIVDFKFYAEKGCAFVKFDSHERAASAIVQLAGFNVNGRPLKCGWGRDKSQVNRQPQASFK